MVQKLPSDFQVYAIRKSPRITDLKLLFIFIRHRDFSPSGTSQIIKTMFPLLLVGLGLIFFGPQALALSGSTWLTAGAVEGLLALPLVLGMCAFESSPAAKRVYTREELIKIASAVRLWVLQAGNPIRKHLCNGMEFIVSLAIEDARPVWSDPLFQTWTEVGDMADGWLIDAFPEGVPPEIESEVKRWIVNDVAVMPFAEGKRIYGKGRVYVPSSFLWRNASITLLEGTSQEGKLSFVMAAQGISKGIAEKIMRLALPEKIPGVTVGR
jgi:hypothetical protein